MNAGAAHLERWREGLDPESQADIVRRYEAELDRLERRGLPLRRGPAPLV